MDSPTPDAPPSGTSDLNHNCSSGIYSTKHSHVLCEDDAKQVVATLNWQHVWLWERGDEPRVGEPRLLPLEQSHQPSSE
eukprot:scaffold231834_cov40-Prasinocladus_malaysianus.AAC.1